MCTNMERTDRGIKREWMRWKEGALRYNPHESDEWRSTATHNEVECEERFILLTLYTAEGINWIKSDNNV